MNLIKSLCLAALAVLVGCSSMTIDAATRSVADSQVGGGLIMPTSVAPVSLGDEGMMYVYPGAADGGQWGTNELNLCGTSPDFAIQWNPALCNDSFGLYTAPSGVSAFVVQLPWPSAGRGNAAEPDAIQIDWTNMDGSTLGQLGLDDGWVNLPEGVGIPYIQMVTDAGWYHPNIVWGWNATGAIDIPTNVATYGEDYEDGWDTGDES